MLEFVYELCVSLLLVFFFFQAEDGIRDLTVTGVQTCALPIYQRSLSRDQRLGDLRYRARIGAAFEPRGRLVFGDQRVRDRSEERRVGKEGRSRWSPYH